VPLSNFVPRGFGFVHHSKAILYHGVPNLGVLVSRFATFSSQYVGRRRTSPASAGALLSRGSVFSFFFSRSTGTGKLLARTVARG
jgi:hypothetical protein